MSETLEETVEVEQPVLLPSVEPEDFDLFDPEDDTPDLTPPVTDDLDEDELRRRLAQAEKRAEHERTLRVQTAQKTWVGEASEHFPYSQPETIQAQSRREFLRIAKEQDQRFRAQAQPLLDKLETERAALRASIEAEVRKEAEQAWGVPSLGAPAGIPDTTETDNRLAQLRKGGDGKLKNIARTLMDSGRI